MLSETMANEVFDGPWTPSPTVDGSRLIVKATSDGNGARYSVIRSWDDGFAVDLHESLDRGQVGELVWRLVRREPETPVHWPMDVYHRASSSDRRSASRSDSDRRRS